MVKKKRTLCAAYTQESPLSLFWIMLAITGIAMFCKILETSIKSCLILIMGS